ncbi:hypothetical protein HZA56_11900, partial [Candidatus Poribacteria bacterium]|nr:hypothetical protein [Candidatus Poribacteria bacterium]
FDSWAVIFYLLSLNLFVYYRIRGRTTYFLSSFLWYVAGTLCKELVYTLPLTLIMLDPFLVRLRSISISWRKRVIEYTPFWAVIFLVALLTKYVFRLRIGYLTDAGDDVFSLYLSNFAMLFDDATAILLRGIAFSFAPISPEFSHQAMIQASVLIGVAATVVILAWRRAIDLRAVGLCLILMIITLIPVIGAYRTIGLRHWSRFLYLPSVGSCYILSMIACGVGDRWKHKLFRIAVPVFFVIPALALTKYYDRQWLAAQTITKRIVETIRSEYPVFRPYTRFYVSGIPWGHKGVPLFATGFPTAMGLAYDRKNVEGNLSFLPPNIVVDLDKENSREKDWTSPQYVLLSFDPESYSLTPAKSPEFDSDARPPAFDFLKWTDQATIEISAGMSRVWGANMTYPLFIVTDKWAMLKLPPIRIGPPIKYVTFEMMLKKKANTRDVVRLFWVTRKDTNYDGPKSIAFYADADGLFHGYRIPLYRNGLTLYDPEIRRFALRPSQDVGTLFSIKSMSIEYY